MRVLLLAAVFCAVVLVVRTAEGPIVKARLEVSLCSFSQLRFSLFFFFVLAFAHYLRIAYGGYQLYCALHVLCLFLHLELWWMTFE